MAIDYTKMWEAFVGGWGNKGAVTQKESIGENRMLDFYNEFVGPAFGAKDYSSLQPGEDGFGDA